MRHYILEETVKKMGAYTVYGATKGEKRKKKLKTNTVQG
jgi:hypothetical protein